jgi:FAD/FMN-containing dehydrogenase
MRQVTVDPATRRARCGGGATQADLDTAAQAHGLAVTGGTISHTGVGGLTLGGGIGWLVRRCGLAADNLVSAQVVLADGRCLRATEDEHADLLWALTGGGGNFGVVTEFEFHMHDVGPIVHLGLQFWELGRSADALRVARDAVEALPRDAGGIIVAMNAPPAPFVPTEHHFVPGVALLVTGFSSAEEHAGLVAEPRRRLAPLFELVTEIPYTGLQQLLDEAAPWGIRAYSKSLHLDDLDDRAIDVIAERLPGKTSPMSLVPIFSLDGAFADRGDDDTAFGGRRSTRYVVNVEAVAPDPEALAADREWVRSLWAALQPFAAGPGGYVNFMAEFETNRVRAAYGEAKWRKLARIKQRYDPDNVFHHNANIPPERSEPGGFAS